MPARSERSGFAAQPIHEQGVKLTAGGYIGQIRSAGKFHRSGYVAGPDGIFFFCQTVYCIPGKTQDRLDIPNIAAFFNTGTDRHDPGILADFFQIAADLRDGQNKVI